jgi:hypothetical protein
LKPLFLFNETTVLKMDKLSPANCAQAIIPDVAGLQAQASPGDLPANMLLCVRQLKCHSASTAYMYFVIRREYIFQGHNTLVEVPQALFTVSVKLTNYYCWRFFLINPAHGYEHVLQNSTRSMFQTNASMFQMSFHQKQHRRR